MKETPVRRGELYLVNDNLDDPKRSRVFLVASRDRFLEAPYSSATCVPVYSNIQGLATEVLLDESNGLKHPSAARCDELHRILRRDLRTYVGSLSLAQLRGLSRALATALQIDPLDLDGL